MAERISRRRLLKLAVAAAGTALLSASDLGRIPLPSAQTAPALAQTPLEALKAVEDKQGDKSLTVKQAHNHLDYVAEWVGSRDDGIFKDPALLKKSTFFITRGSNFSSSQPFDRSSVFKYPEVIEFAKNYPNIGMNEGLARAIIGLYRLGHTRGAFGMTVNKERLAYLNLDIFNLTEPQSDPQRRIVQYLGDEPATSCRSAAPIVASRSITEHEWVHLEGLYTTDDERPLDDEVIKSFKKTFQKALANIPEPKISGRKRNFDLSVLIQSDGRLDSVFSDYPLLNEISTDHMPIRQAQEAGLAYIIGYGFKPVDHINLRRVLDQSSLALKNFAHLYKGSYISEFYQSLALGAQVDLGNPAKLFNGSTPAVDLIGFSIVRFPPDLPPNWNGEIRYPEPIKPHFPLIDDRELTYSLESKVNTGCILTP